MIRLLTTLSLLTTVKCDAADLQVQTVRSGDDITLKCEHYMDKNDKNQHLSWYKQSLGKVPDDVVRSFVDGREPRFPLGFSDGRFTVDALFNLSIKGIKEEDAGTYFCGKVKTNFIDFGSGTLLLFEAEKMNFRPLTEMVIETGESVTLQCSVQSLTSDCSGEHSVYWFRHGSGESHPGIIYTHGNRSDQCKSSSETDSSTQSCVYKLPKRKLSLSDAGTYYCAVAACGQILFGNGTEVNVQVHTDVSGLQVQTVRSGDNVTIKCDENIIKDKKTHYLAWYKQSLGNVPEPVLRLFGDGRKIRYSPSFSDGHFTADEEVFDLSIKGIKEEDAGTYFCGKVQTNYVEFGSGTLLFLQGEHSVYWFRHGSGESHPGIIYTHGNRSDQCKSSSETDSSTQSCVYKLPKRNLSLSDAGTYYCAVAACGQILFGNGTEVNVQGSSISCPSRTDQVEDTEGLNYAALRFSKKLTSRAPRAQESPVMYSQVKHSS
ncbi:hypothetical protein NFI96_009520 [Prochilodus magdalenae]|nr:hypothetical protein NFI96_009520 [Prochilodus magdalenae]